MWDASAGGRMLHAMSISSVGRIDQWHVAMMYVAFGGRTAEEAFKTVQPTVKRERISPGRALHDMWTAAGEEPSV